jgi:regulator of RNase E activity RraB
MTQGAVQAETAYRQYQGASVTVDGKTIEFNPSKWIYYGENNVSGLSDKKLAYSIMELIPNKTFNDLKSEGSGLDLKTIAKAVIAIELGYVLTGNPIDADPHGSNRNVYGENNVGVFDYGERSLTPPSKEAKLYLGKVLAKTYEEAQKSDNKKSFIEDVFSSAVKDAEGMNKDVHSYISKINYMLLALTDYFKELDFESNGDATFIEDVLNAVNEGGYIDNTIREGFTKSLSSGKKTTLGLKFFTSLFTGKKQKAQGLIIKFGDKDLDVKPDFAPLTEADMQKLTDDSKKDILGQKNATDKAPTSETPTTMEDLSFFTKSDKMLQEPALDLADLIEGGTLKKLIVDAKTTEDIMKIDNLMKGVASFQLNAARFDIMADLITKLEAAKIKIEVTEKASLKNLDAKVVLCSYANISMNLSNSEVIDETLDALANDLKANSERLSSDALSKLAREEVVAFMLANTAKDVPVFTIISSFKNILDVEGTKYDVDYYKKPEFEKFKTELYELKMLKK